MNNFDILGSFERDRKAIMNKMLSYIIKDYIEVDKK